MIPKEIILIDMVSHSEMHLPFNEGYVKAVSLAFPSRRIVFAACSGHVKNLKRTIEHLPNVEFKVVPQFDELLEGHSHHHPIYGRKAAKFYTNWIKENFDLENIGLITILGARAPMINVMKRFWKKMPGECHYLQHNQLGISMDWRSRNPIERYFDYISVLKRGLPKNQKLIVLELGLDEVIVDIAPAMKGSVEVIEHPVLQTEWLPPTSPNLEGPIKVAFLGHCGRGKGFDTFCDIAKKFSSSRLEFYAIGKENSSQAADFDTSSLCIAPSKTHLAREKFVELLRQIDLVCLPLPSSVSYVSSGSIIDAFAAAKPLITSTNQSHRAIKEKYGEFGVLASEKTDFYDFFEELANNPERALEYYEKWKETTIKIRESRSESSIACLFTRLMK